MNKLPLLDALMKYHKENNLILSMPGNKCGKAFEVDDIGREFAEKLGYLDITEVDPLDNLHHPEGVIKEAQDLLKEYYGSKKAFFIVNGSTGGNLASIFAAFNEGDEVLVERNCHKSIINALILRKLKVTYIEPIILENGIFLPPNEEKIYEALNRCVKVKGIILTYPNYFGISYNLEDVILDLKKKGLKVIIDQAHGAHFGVCEELPMSLTKIADYIVVSAHKTLPALTGGSYLLVNDEDSNIEFYVSAFMTTSPSYLVMASLDYARYYLESYGKKEYKKLINIAEEYKVKINSLGKVKILCNKDLPEGYEIDKSRYLLVLKEGYSGHKLLDYFRKEGIQGEMSIDSAVVFILSPCNNEEDFKKIYEAINKLDLNNIKGYNSNIYGANFIPLKALEPYEVLNMKEEKCKLKNSVGRILKESIIPYPPGIPIICSGEIISEEIIDKINLLRSSGVTVIGIDNNNEIKVV